jgi:hypothetical protein
VARATDDAVQRHLDHTAVRYHQHVSMRVSFHDVVHRGRDSCLEQGRALAAGHNVPVRLLDPRRPRLWKPFGYLRGRQPFPVAEEDLAEGRLGRRSLPDRRAYGFGGLEGPLEVAGVEPGEPSQRQAVSEELGLAQPFGRQRGVELALDAVLAVPRGLAVANQYKARGGGFGG